MAQAYNAPTAGSASTVGSQFRTDMFYKKALVEAKKEMYFSQMANTRAMPKHMGKKIVQYHYIPLLDDANINDQGIDAAGVSTVKSISIRLTMEDGSVPNTPLYSSLGGGRAYFVGEGATAAAAEDAVVAKVVDWAATPAAAGGLGLTLVGADNDAKFAEVVNSTDGQAYLLGYRFDGHESVATLAATAVAASGNIYGSSKDVGTVSGKLPAIDEFGGRKNRVGFRRVELEGTFEKFGFFREWTQESLDFDTDAELDMHLSREMIIGANQMNEDALQIDLLNGAGVIRFGGDALGTSEVTGNNGETPSVISYEDLMRLSIDLDNNHCPKSTQLISGSRMTDTRTIDSARYIYIGSELLPQVKKMVDPFGNPAFVPIHQYADAGSIAQGEVGSVDQWRFIVVPNMFRWEGAGKAVTINDGYRETDGNYDVYPMLAVGSGSFTTIGFQTDGKTVKFSITTKKPGKETADRTDPYGETGFTSIKWYYGSMILRPEWIALCKCVAEW